MSLNKASLIRKLSTLSTSQDSIQSLSLWLFHFSKHADDIVKVWQQELKQAPTKQKLKFIFLANDVILQGRKKGMAYITAFQPVLPTVLPEVYKVLDAKGQQQLIRVISIWQDRAAYPVEFLNELRKRLRSSQPVASANSSGPAVSTDALQDVDLGQPINKRELFRKVDAHEEQFPSLAAAMAKIRSLPPAVFDDRPIKDITSESHWPVT
ncbi:hypothetical protein PTSG_01206 [Salpingoeca rosetta]|uniref:CID domain-containing protein n=1 Tax=Salpingoeca rosetta (strain ATCC 50818 / BSB-021) TaxID=946362 RepID=F2U143_SALR5|nr:uncharacterized protein PTSG_01206 [Salpingoeca rosetta]EGD80617.1 hypothetical protein PTSG_01206 [Salpingoeca rosetta]|eukprot:XP_004997178.1 hypothetical protein PTSG_01206 [Salpingoeca rosetta]